MNDPTIALEENVLGAILLDASQADSVELSEDDFLTAKHRRIYQAIRYLRDRNQVIDAITVAEHLCQEPGSDQWLMITAGLAKDTCSPGNARVYADLVKQRSRTRQAMHIAADLQTALTSEPAEAIDRAIRSLMDLNQSAKSWSCRISEALGQAIDEIDAYHQNGGKAIGLPTGIRDLDEKLGGMHRSDLIVVGARPAMGKTAFMLNTALGCGSQVGIISGEQGRLQIALRLIGIRGQVKLHNMRLGRVDDHEWERITGAVSALQVAPIWVFDKPAPTIDEIERQARRWKYENGIKVLMVDYIQKIEGGAGRDKRLQVGDVVSRLKNLARELDMPVLALAQLNREVEKRTLGEDGMGRMGFMGDFAESAIIEMESDQCFTLYRPEVYIPEQRFKGLAVINICKNRHGPIGMIDVAWRGEYLQFGDLAHAEESAIQSLSQQSWRGE
jgi:replicative DNA helicase